MIKKKNKKTKINDSSDSDNEDSSNKLKKKILEKNSDNELNKNSDSMKGETIITKSLNQESNNENENNTNENNGKENESNMFPSLTMKDSNTFNQGNSFYMSNIKNENDIENENKEKQLDEEIKEDNDQINNIINKSVSIGELFDATFEMNKSTNNKIKNYQNDMEKIIKKEFDDLKINNSLESKLGLYLKFRDTYHLTYRETVKFENSNIKCKYCEKDIFGYVYKIKIEHFKEIAYCSLCIYKIISKFKSPITINLEKSIEKVKDIPERIKDYTVEIDNIEINDNSISNKNIEYDYGEVEKVIKLKFDLKNAGKNNWPSNSKLDVDKLNPNNFFSIGHTTLPELKTGQKKSIELELRHLDTLPPGKYPLILGVYTKNKAIFGDINGMTFKFNIN